MGREFVARLVAGLVVIFNSPALACMAQGGMFVPLGIFSILYIPWGVFAWFRETRWLVTHIIWIPGWFRSLIDPLSLVLIAAGLAIFLAAFAQLAKRKKELVVTGLYSLMRHPQYFGIALTFLGIALLGKKPASIVAWITMIFAYIALARIEEEALQRRHGKEFLLYKWRVPFFPLPSGVSRRLSVLVPSSKAKTYALLLIAYVLTVTATVVGLEPISYPVS